MENQRERQRNAEKETEKKKSSEQQNLVAAFCSMLLCVAEIERTAKSCLLLEHKGNAFCVFACVCVCVCVCFNNTLYGVCVCEKEREGEEERERQKNRERVVRECVCAHVERCECVRVCVNVAYVA